MNRDDERAALSSRDKKIEGRAKRRRYVQGTRSYLHALTNSVAKRGAADERTSDGK